MSTLFQTFSSLVDAKAAAVYGNEPPQGMLMLDWLAHLSETPAKLGLSKPIAKAYFELSNSRYDIVQYANAHLDLFWSPSAKMDHPYGLAKVLGLHASLMSTPNGFSVFLDYPEDDRPKVMEMARARSMDAYVASLVRLMASGSLNTFHALAIFKPEDFEPFSQPVYQSLLTDLVAGVQGSLSCSDRNKCSIAEVMWLTGHQDFARQLFRQHANTASFDSAGSMQAMLQSAFLAGGTENLERISHMAADLYDFDDQKDVYDKVLAKCIKSPSIKGELLHGLLIDRARQCHEIGTIDQIKHWLPDYLSRNTPEVRDPNGSPLLWTILALNPSWIAKNKGFCESMADPHYLRAAVGFTDVDSWHELITLASAENDTLFWTLEKLDPNKVRELGLAPSVIAMFLSGVDQERTVFASLGDPEAFKWERLVKATENLARNLGAYCKVGMDKAEIEAVFEVLSQARFRRAFLESLPRFPELLKRLPGEDVDNLLSGDLGL